MINVDSDDLIVPGLFAISLGVIAMVVYTAINIRLHLAEEDACVMRGGIMITVGHESRVCAKRYEVLESK